MVFYGKKNHKLIFFLKTGLKIQLRYEVYQYIVIHFNIN
jgi:hypothetical protein